MKNLWSIAWALQGLTRTLDIEESGLDDTPFERDRLSGIATAAHLLSSHLLRFADPFNEAMYSRHDDTLDALLMESDENELRKPFTPSEAIAMKKMIEGKFKAEAKARQSANGGDVSQKRYASAGSGGTASERETRHKLAKAKRNACDQVIISGDAGPRMTRRRHTPA